MGLLTMIATILIVILILVTIKINEQMAIDIGAKCNAVLVENTDSGFWGSGYKSNCTQDNRFNLSPMPTPNKT